MTPALKRDLRLWSSAAYKRARAEVVAVAYRNPDHRCWRCGNPLHHPCHTHRDGSLSIWTAGHINSSDPRSPIAAEASLCNYSAGGRLGRARQNRRSEARSPNA